MFWHSRTALCDTSVCKYRIPILRWNGRVFQYLRRLLYLGYRTSLYEHRDISHSNLRLAAENVPWRLGYVSKLEVSVPI